MHLERKTKTPVTLLDIKRALRFPAKTFSDWRLRRSRIRFEKALNQLVANDGLIQGSVIIDGLWDNPNYWTRVTLIGKALGLTPGQMIGVTGPYQSDKVACTFARMGIKEVYDFDAIRSTGQFDLFQSEAREILSGIRDPSDILKLDLPFSFPASFLYDAILKEQRTAAVDILSPQLVELTSECIGYLYQAKELMKRAMPQLVIMSHVVSHRMGPLAWIALTEGVEVALLFGNYGTLRFSRLSSLKDFFDTTDRPHKAEIESIPREKRPLLKEATVRYMQSRLKGASGDIGARYAFARNSGQISRDQLCRRLGWSSDRPIISVYASNWFDFPHACGLRHFRDFLDWMQLTVSVAHRASGFNWLLKPHPCDEWYGGVTLKDLVSHTEVSGNVRLSPDGLSSQSIMELSDALVTVHGTAGIEFALHSKPVLLADRGWYSDTGIGLLCNSREEYIQRLESRWWENVDTDSAKESAYLFAGIYFTAVEWQNGLLFRDDSEQWSIYGSQPELIQDHEMLLRREMMAIRSWFLSSSKRYHTWKHLHECSSPEDSGPQNLPRQEQNGGKY